MEYRVILAVQVGYKPRGKPSKKLEKHRKYWVKRRKVPQYRYSVSEYIIRKRMDHTQHLLIATDLSIAEVDKAVGYERSDSFSSQFFRITGLLPTVYCNLTSPAK